ncbi:MAG: polyphosphate polymerase domain-containing protein [Lachnospiraceae bacterium]|nr:polyphosphate polymerase domain-containing protein [Lachnospiraceae bacterium]
MAFRHELKFLISESEEKALQDRWKPIISYDKHAGPSGYTIRSLYFDDFYGTALYDKLAGVNERSKYRIRIYDGKEDVIRLERKEKVGQYIRKTGAGLSQKELDSVFNGNASILLTRNEQVCKDFYIETVTNGMHPVVLVDYDRVPFVFPYGDVRVTFDEHVRAGAWTGDLFDMDTPVYEVVAPGMCILEVKFTEYLPDVVRDLLPTSDAARVAASKYVMCLQKRAEMLGRAAAE